MEPEYKSSVVWFVGLNDGSCQAAVKCLSEYNVKMELRSQNQTPFREGILKRKGKDNIKIYLVYSKDYLKKPLPKIIGNANKIFLSGTCSGRPGSVRLGNIILVNSCYDIDNDADAKMDGSVVYYSRPVEVSETAMLQLKNLAKTKIDVGQKCPRTKYERREEVLDYLNNADKSLPIKEFHKIATDVNANDKIRTEQWQNCIFWLKDVNKYIKFNLENQTMTITEKGKKYCKDNNLGSIELKSEHPTIHIGATVTSTRTHGDLKDEKSWEKFDRKSLKIIGIERSAYKILSNYPDTIVVQAVKNYAKIYPRDVKDYSWSEYVDKLAAIAVRSFIWDLNTGNSDNVVSLMKNKR